tara:strand:- start:193 stop:1083 length:891 start_codon:yes stop_codon:yes gene_type:complete
MPIMKHFQDMGSFHLMDLNYVNGEHYKVFYLNTECKEECRDEKRLYFLPHCPHDGAIMYNDVCLCGCFDCVSDRKFTWGYTQTFCEASCLDFKRINDTIQSSCGPSISRGEIKEAFPCNGSVYGRELTYEEIVSKIINKQIFYIENGSNKNILSVKDVKKLMPKQSKKILKKYLGTNYNDNYIINDIDIEEIKRIAVNSTDGTLPPEIHTYEIEPFKIWEQQNLIDSFYEYSLNHFEISKEERFARLKELEIKNRLDKKNELCEKILELVETMKINGIDDKNYFEIKDHIMILSDL